MISAFELTADADAAAEGTGGVQIHVDITQLPTAPPPLDGLATTGADLPVLLIVAAVALIAVGAVILMRRARRRA